MMIVIIFNHATRELYTTTAWSKLFGDSLLWIQRILGFRQPHFSSSFLFSFTEKKPPLLLCCSLTLTFSNFPPCQPGGGRQNSWFLKNLLYHHHQNENDKKETQRENLGWCLLSRNVGRLRRLRGRDIRCLDLQLFFSIFWCFKRFQTVSLTARPCSLLFFFKHLWHLILFFKQKKKIFCTVCPLNLLAMSKWAKFKVFFKVYKCSNLFSINTIHQSAKLWCIVQPLAHIFFFHF